MGKKLNNNDVSAENNEVTAVAERTENSMSIVSDIKEFINLNTSGFYTSMMVQDENDQLLLYNALSSPDYQLADFINKSIELTNIVAEPVELTNEETGETSICPRIILIDADGNSYSCVSHGIKNSLSRLFTIFGTPDTWDAPKIITIGQRQIKGNRKVLTINLEAKGKK